MSLQAYLAFVAACIALALLPGPVVTLLIANGLRHGTRAALINCAGAQTGLAIVIGVVAGKAAGKSVTEQTQDILSIIDGHLAKAGTDKSKLLSATIYITDMKAFPEMNAVWDGWVSAGNTPARATVEAKLAAPQYNVEIMVVAAR